MSRKKDPNVYQPKDHFSVPETPKESKADFFRAKEHNAPNEKPSGFQPPLVNPSAPKKAKNAGKTLTVFVLAAATAATGVVGYVAVVQSPYIDVDLISRNADSLVFQIAAHNYSTADQLIANLFDGEELLGAVDLAETPFVPFYELTEAHEYRLEVLRFENLNADEPTQEDFERDPESVYSATYRTSSTYADAGIEVMTYENGILEFAVYTEGDYPFLTTKVFDTGKTYLVDDWNGQEKSYRVENLPSGRYFSITVTSNGESLAYFYLEPLPEEDSSSEESSESSEELRPAFSLSLRDEAYITYHSYSATFEISMADEGAAFDPSAISAVLNEQTMDEQTMPSDAISYREGDDAFSLYIDDLDAYTPYSFAFYDENGLLCHEESFTTEDTITIVQEENDMLTATMSPSFFLQYGQDTETGYGFAIVDSMQNVPASGYFEGQDSVQVEMRTPYFGEECTLQYGEMVDGAYVIEPILTKKVTLFGQTRPEFEFSYDAQQKYVTITQTAGAFLEDPTGAAYYTASFYAENANGIDPDASYSENYYSAECANILFSEDSPSVVIDLQTCSIVGETPSYGYNVIPGAYEVTLYIESMTIFQGSFIVE